jgi:hypothetical protein
MNKTIYLMLIGILITTFFIVIEREPEETPISEGMYIRSYDYQEPCEDCFRIPPNAVLCEMCSGEWTCYVRPYNIEDTNSTGDKYE